MKVRWAKPLEQGDVVAIDKPGIVVAGRYAARKRVEVPGQGVSMLHKLLLVEDPQGLGPNVSAGTAIQFWGSTLLDQYLGQITQGQLVRVRYKGKETLPARPGEVPREMKQWEVCPGSEDAGSMATRMDEPPPVDF